MEGGKGEGAGQRKGEMGGREGGRGMGKINRHTSIHLECLNTRSGLLMDMRPLSLHSDTVWSCV